MFNKSINFRLKRGIFIFETIVQYNIGDTELKFCNFFPNTCISDKLSNLKILASKIKNLSFRLSCKIHGFGPFCNITY